MSEINVLDIDITQDPANTDPSQEEIEITSEVATASDEESKTDSEETTTSETKTPKNKSNFKKLAKSNKDKDRRIAELEAKLADESGDTDVETEDDDSDELLYDRVDFLEYVTDTPGAGEIKNQIKEALDEFPGISFDKAFAYAKAQVPQESQSRTVFNAKSSVTSKKKKVTELTNEEAGTANLSPEQYDAWANSQKKEVNPFG